MLLKPWRNLRSDLKQPTDSWATAFEAFHASATPKTRRVLSGIQYFHECESAVQTSTTDHQPYQVSPDAQVLDEESGTDHTSCPQEFSEEGLAALKESSVSLREELHGRMAIELARHLCIFGNEQHKWVINQRTIPLNATQDDLARISIWHNLLQSTVNERGSAPIAVLPENFNTPTVERSTLSSNPPPLIPQPLSYFRLLRPNRPYQQWNQIASNPTNFAPTAS